MSLPFRSPAERNPVGTHLRVGKGLVAGTLAENRLIGAEALQLFTGNPRGWALSPGRPEEDTAFRRGCAEQGLRVFVHAPYLVNLGSPTRQTFERSVATVAHNLGRAAQLGAEGVVVHTGSCVDEGGFAAALRQVRDGLLPLLHTLAESGPGPMLLLEPTAGQGRSLCATVADLGPYLEALEGHPRVGICFDTCHAYAAGEPLDEHGGTTDTLDRLVALIGAERLQLVHANDSADPRGSFRDRHHPIARAGGTGRLGPEAFRELLAHPATAGVPVVLETPGSRDPGDPQLGLLRELRAEVSAQVGVPVGAPVGAQVGAQAAVTGAVR